MILRLVLQRNGTVEHGGQLPAITQQEEKHVQQHAGAGQGIHRVLADVDGLRGQELTDLAATVGQSPLDGRQVQQPLGIQHAVQPARHGLDDLGQVRPEVQIARPDAAVDLRPLIHQRHGQPDHRDDHHHDDRTQRDERGRIGALRHAPHQCPLHGCKQHRQNDGPHQRAIEGHQDGQERQRHQRQETHEEIASVGSEFHRSERKGKGACQGNALHHNLPPPAPSPSSGHPRESTSPQAKDKAKTRFRRKSPLPPAAGAAIMGAPSPTDQADPTDTQEPS